MILLKRIGWLTGIVLLIAVAWCTLAFLTIPHSSGAHSQQVDTLIVLGIPTWASGHISNEGRARADEALREFAAGRAANIIFSGGSAHNQFVEAHAMAAYAVAQGVPASAVVEETQSNNTVQNIFYSAQIMRQHGWHSAEVISSPSHTPRAALILRHWDFGWQVQSCAWPNYEWWRIAGHYPREAAYDAWLRVVGFRASPFLPRG